MSQHSTDIPAETFAISVETRLGRAPDDVFGLVSDLPRSGEWSPECRGGTWVSGPPGAVGSVFRGRNRRSPEVVAWAPVARGEWHTEAEVVAAESPSTFSWAMRDSTGRIQDSVWTFDIRPVPGGSVLTHTFRMGELTEGMRGIQSGMTDAEQRRFVAEWSEKLTADMRATVEKIKSVLESGPAREEIR